MAILYVTEMLRWGEDESHHYIIGVYTKKKHAELAGDCEKSWRGGKYEYRIVEVELDRAIPKNELMYHNQCAGE